MPMNFEELHQQLALIQQSRDSLLYAQFQDWLASNYEDAKERLVRCAPEDRENMAGQALALCHLLNDLNKTVQH